MKRLWGVFALVLLSAAGSYAQNGMIALPPVLINAQGQPLAGVNVAVCSSLTTSVAAVSNNIATLTVSSTTGFTAGMTLNVSGFTGADTFFNVSAPIVSLSATTLSYALTHANASASSNGSVYQTGNSSTPCAPLATLYTDHSTTTVTANPFTSTGLGNVLGWAPPAQYEIQSYGTGVTTTVQQVAIACVPNSGGTPGCTVVTNQTNTFTLVQNFGAGLNVTSGVGEFQGGISADGTHTETIPSTTSTLLDLATAQSPLNKNLTTASNGNNVTLLNYQGTLSPITGTGAAATYYTYALPANVLAANKCLRITARAKHSTGTNAANMSLSFGGTSTTVMGDDTTSTSALTDTVYRVCNGASTSAQTMDSTLTRGLAGTIFLRSDTAAVNTTSGVTINAQFNVANTDALTPMSFIVELIQ